MDLALVLFFVIAALATVAGRGRRPPPFRLRRLAHRLRPYAVVALPTAFAAQCATAYGVAESNARTTPWLAALPLRIVWVAHWHEPLAFATFAAVVVETAALAALILGGVDLRTRRRLAIALAVIAVAAPAMTTSDPYYYAVAGMRGLAAYRTNPNDVLPFAFLERHVPLRGSLYGPLWILYDAAVTALGTTLQAKIVLLRLAGASLVLLGADALRRVRFGPSVRAAFLLNPMIWWYCVANVHNDVAPIVLLLYACAFARGRRYGLAAALVAAAGCYKLPFLVVGLVVLREPRSVRTRVLLAAAALLACAGVSALFGGREYLANLTSYSLRPHEQAHPDPVALLVTVGSLAAIAAAVFRRRLLPGAAWSMIGLAPLALPWYFLWGIPYAVVARRGALRFLLLLPYAALFTERMCDPLLAAAVAAPLVGYATFAARRPAAGPAA